MADQHRRRRDDDSEGSFSESDVEIEKEKELKITSEAEVTLQKEEEENPVKVAEGSDYESAEELDEKSVLMPVDDVKEKIQETEKTEEIVVEAEAELPKVPEPEEPLSEIVDEEGGKEGAAEVEDVEGDFLSGDVNEDASQEEEDDEEEEDGEYVEEERQQGDGEECSPDADGTEKELDFDEDRRNPQYIPKKGVFYEHDDRNNEDIKEKEEEPTRDRKKKLWLDEGKWAHDRFREEEQYPKSRGELIESYGYDIRNEDGPPRARRRRRYGRGPTKYDRSWEDVTAYGREKSRGPPQGLNRGKRGVGRFRGGPRFRGRGRSEYDSEHLVQNGEVNTNNEVPDEKEIEATDATEPKPIINNVEFPALPTKPLEPEEDIIPEQTYFNKNPTQSEPKSVRTLMFENSNYSNRNSSEREVPLQPPRRGKTPPFSSNHERGVRRGNPRGTRGHGRGEFNRRGRGTRHISPRFLENKVSNLSSNMENLSLDTSETCNDGSESIQHEDSNGVHSTNGPELISMSHKGANDSSGRPKRYSSLRQRSLPETNTYQPPQQQHAPYYETGYQSGLYAPSDTCVPTPSTQSQSVSSTTILNPSAYQAYTPPPYTDNYGIRLPVATPPPALFPQVSVPGSQPILAPPPCITPAPNLIGFAPPPPPAGYHQFTYQRYATPPPPPLPQPVQQPPTDMYQTGITYYYPQNQAPPVRPTVQKRPKAAIPIVPPPEREGTRTDKETPSSNNRSYSDTSTDQGNDVSLRTESSPQLQQPTIGVES